MIAGQLVGATKDFAQHLRDRGVEFSVGASFAHLEVHTALALLSKTAWTPAYQAKKPAPARPRRGSRSGTGRGSPKPPGWLTSRPGRAGTRLILHKERPHPGAQLRITDADGMRVTGFLTNTTPGGLGRQLADLELRHRRHARVEDRIRTAKDTGLRNLPFHDLSHNRIWVAIATLPADLLAWCKRLALPAAAGYEPKRLRLRLLAVAGRLVTTPDAGSCTSTPPGPGPT